MVIWRPHKEHELRRVYDLCMAMGAPGFMSPDQMLQWLRTHSDTVQSFVRNKYHERIRVTVDVVTELVAYLKDVYAQISKVYDASCWLLFKALHKPLTVNPRSLHPIDQLA